MKILVTGGVGFLGQAFADKARVLGHEVVTVDRAGEVDHRSDVGDPEAITAIIVAARCEIVVHLAAMLTDESAADPVAATRVNALGTAAVFAAARSSGVKRVVYASSVAAVGSCHEGSGDDVALSPGTIYGVTKAFGEHLARAMSDAPGALGFVVLRFGWIYGPGRLRGWRVAQDVIEQFARGARKVSYPDFPATMDWTYIDDATEVLMRAVERPLPKFAAFNVVGDRRTVREAIAHLQTRFPAAEVQPIPATTPASGWGIRNDGLEQALGYSPSTRLEEGIDAMLVHLRQV